MSNWQQLTPQQRDAIVIAALRVPAKMIAIKLQAAKRKSNASSRSNGKANKRGRR